MKKTLKSKPAVLRSFLPSKPKPIKPLLYRAVDAKYVGAEEPSWPGVEEQAKWTQQEYSSRVGAALNWYNAAGSAKLGHELAVEALSASGHAKELVADIKSSSKMISHASAWLIRMAHAGLRLHFREARTVAKAIRECANSPKSNLTSEGKPKPTIQDHITAKLCRVKGEIDAAFDDFIASNYKTSTKAVEQMLVDPQLSTPGNRTKDLIEYAQEYLNEYQAAISGRKIDEDIAEAYNHLGKRQIKAAIEWWEKAIADINQFAQQRQSLKVVRPKKAKPPAKIISKLRYLKSFPDLGLTSIDATQILKSTELWVYNTKLRKIGHYVAVSGTTFEVRGTRILNIDTVHSVQKVLRKPVEQLKQFAAQGKPGSIKWFASIAAVATPLREALNADSILLRAVK